MKLQKIPSPPEDVTGVLAEYPPAARKKLLSLRRLIFATARGVPVVGELTETLKWGQPAYLTEKSRSGSTIRIGWSPSRPDECGLYFHCGTTLVSDFRYAFSETLHFEGNRAIILSVDQPLPRSALEECISDALTYHHDKRQSKIARTRAKRKA